MDRRSVCGTDSSRKTSAEGAELFFVSSLFLPHEQFTTGRGSFKSDVTKYM